MKKPSMRLDEALKKAGLVSSREKAKALILDGQVSVNGSIISKPSFQVEDESLTILKTPYVSRSAEKLLKALEAWSLDLKDQVILDIGASTGGFTQVALEKGAKKVCALDVGHDQLDARLKNDPRVINLENIHFLKTRKEDFAAFDTVFMDVSFISSLKLLSHAKKIVVCSTYLVLFKPQFETKKPQKEAIISLKKRFEIKAQWLEEVALMGFEVIDTIDVMPGKKGNQETMMYLKVKAC